MNNEAMHHIERKIDGMIPLDRREIMLWVNKKMREARKKETVKYFESIINKLARAIALNFGVENYRCVIFKITDSTYERVAEDISERHNKERIFPRDKMPPPIKELVENDTESVYIEDALSNPMTQYMRELVISANIKDMYYSKVVSSSNTWVIVVDGIGEKRVDERKRDFLDILTYTIQNIEEDLVEIKMEVKESVVKTKLGVTSFLLELLSHLLGTKTIVIEWCSREITKIAAANGDHNGGNCQKCIPKARAILNDFEALDEILKQFGIAVHDIKKSGEFKITNISFSEIFEEFANIYRDVYVELENYEKEFIIATDKRKVAKALCRIIDQLIQKNRREIKISLTRPAPGKIKALIQQEGINTEKLYKLVNLSPACDTITDHTFKDFNVVISATLLAEIDVNLIVNKDSVEMIFPEVSTLKRRKTD